MLQHVPRYVRICAKRLLSRIPVQYAFWQKVCLIRHGQMDDLLISEIDIVLTYFWPESTCSSIWCKQKPPIFWRFSAQLLPLKDGSLFSFDAFERRRAPWRQQRHVPSCVSSWLCEAYLKTMTITGNNNSKIVAHDRTFVKTRQYCAGVLSCVCNLSVYC